MSQGFLSKERLLSLPSSCFSLIHSPDFSSKIFFKSNPKEGVKWTRVQDWRDFTKSRIQSGSRNRERERREREMERKERRGKQSIKNHLIPFFSSPTRNFWLVSSRSPSSSSILSFSLTFVFRVAVKFSVGCNHFSSFFFSSYFSLPPQRFVELKMYIEWWFKKDEAINRIEG